MEQENKLSQMLLQYGTKRPVQTHVIPHRIPTVDEIEKQDVVAIAGCSFNGTESNSWNDLNQLITNKKKTRRKPRHKKDSQSEGSYKVGVDVLDCAQNHKGGPDLISAELAEIKSLSDLLTKFKITAVTNQTNGKVVRIKNGTCTHIHISTSFLSSLGRDAPEIRAASHKSSSSSNAIIHPNDTVYSDYYKSPVQIKNGTAANQFRLPQLDTSNLQSSSTNLQCAGISNSPKRKLKIKRKEKKFPFHWSLPEVKNGLLSGELLKGIVRINAKNFREAYVSNEDRSQQDYVLQSLADRNRALEGDVVAIKLKPQSEWTEKQKTAVVVHILEEVHPRTAVGVLQPMPDKNKRYALFIPRDCKVPRIRVPTNVCPPAFHQNPNRYESIMYQAKITSWKEIRYAVGTIIANVGVLGDLESETAALLAEYCLDVTPFSPDMLQYVPVGEGIPAEEYEYRQDLRKECIFTIDPLTARDLDDAVSCKELDNGNLEIGVHISDVTYYLAEGTPLDKMVSQKATTIYLVNSVYHMLPQELCLHCSLLPGEDKLAFSVFWEMTKSGEIVRHRFARTVINSCVQLAYEHAQAMIENPECVFDENELPQIFGGFTYKDLSRTVNYLQAIAVNLRAKRFENGALRIDQTKLVFRLDPDTSEPTECLVYENKEANRLIEEFMLLANISVAQRILEDFPELAFLRCHEPPHQHLLVDLQNHLKHFGVQLDISSSKALQASIWSIQDNKSLGISGMAALQYLIAKPMTRARYLCAADTDSDETFEHYALHVPLYTHFTSPIRRYADIMVHRLLSASLGYTETPYWETTYVSDIAANCNKQKYNAKCAGDASSDLFLAHYIAQHQPFIQSAVVVDVKNSSFDVLVVGTGSVIRMYPNNFDDDVECIQEQGEGSRKFMVVFSETPTLPEECYVIQLFSVVKVSLHRKPKTNKLEARLLRPIRSQSFTTQGSDATR